MSRLSQFYPFLFPSNFYSRIPRWNSAKPMHGNKFVSPEHDLCPCDEVECDPPGVIRGIFEQTRSRVKCQHDQVTIDFKSNISDYF